MTPDQLNHTEASPIETPQPRRGWRTLGPGLLITAAFIGPGTVTKATVAGARYGYALMWAVAFSALATIVFQEMSARLGIVTQRGLGEALRKVFSTKETRIPSVTLVVAAIALGNAAYQTGNVVGAATGINALLGGGDVGQTTWCLLIGLAAMVVLWIGHVPNARETFGRNQWLGREARGETGHSVGGGRLATRGADHIASRDRDDQVFALMDSREHNRAWLIAHVRS